MSRGLGEADVVSQLPETVVGIAGVVTQLGDMWFVVLGVALVSVGARWRPSLARDPLRDGLYLLALAMGAYAFTVVLKHAFALPRPPGAGTATPPGYLPAVADGLYESLVTGDGYGFPSGHALKSAAVYGGAALTLTTWSRQRRLAGWGVVVGLVAASRVVLGVHYLVDVVVGVVLGVAFLGAVDNLTDRRPEHALLVSFAVGALAFGMTAGYEAGLVVLVSLASVLVWRWQRDESGPTPSSGVGEQSA